MTGSTATAPKNTMRLGIRENAAQFALLVLINGFVGAMVGMERSILPALAEQEFHQVARVAILSFIAIFGLAKALANIFAGVWADKAGRKRVLVAGWLVSSPVPFLLMWAPLVFSARRQRLAGSKSGAHLVRCRHHEDRSRRPKETRPGHGPERGGRLPCGGPVCCRYGLGRWGVRPPA